MFGFFFNSRPVSQEKWFNNCSYLVTVCVHLFHNLFQTQSLVKSKNNFQTDKASFLNEAEL